MQHLIFFYCNNAPQCYVVCTLLVLCSPKHPDRLCGPPRILFKGYSGRFFPGVKWQEREADYWPPYTVRVNIPTYVLITCSGTTLSVQLQCTEIYYSPEAPHSPWSTAEVKNMRNCTPLHSYASITSNFTFTFLSHICRTEVFLQ
jgi:predicted RNA-binding protein with PUA-like domain